MTKICMIENCDKPLYAKQICKAHYELQRRKGRTWKLKEYLPRDSSSEKRLQTYSKLNPQTGCIEWTGASTPDGYGQIKVNRNKNTRRAHIISWEVHNNKSAKGFLVLHACDNRICINPKHLVLGDHKLNMEHMVSKNRQAKGSDHGSAKLNEKQVVKIKKMLAKGNKSQSEIAKIYNVSICNINNIKRNIIWKHVEVSS